MPPRPAALRRLLPAAVVLVLLALALAWWRGGGEDAPALRTEPASRGELRQRISATGTLRALSTVDIGSQVSGQVLAVEVDYNDAVTAGQVLAQLDPAPFRSRLVQAEADLAAARAQLAEATANARNAEADHARKVGLAERRLIAASEADLALAARDQARARIASARASVQQREAAVANVQLDLDYTVIRSPVDGVVLARLVEPGQTVAASLQAPVLFQIAEDLGQMRIELSIDEADVGQVRPGLPVSFTVDAFPDREFAGRVQQVRLAAVESSGVITYPVIVLLANPDGALLPGMTASAEIEVARRDDALRVPNAALRFRPAGAEVEAAAPSGMGGMAGAGDALRRIAESLQLDEVQRSAFEADAEAQRARMEAMAAQRRAGGGGPGPGGPGGPGGAGPGAGMTEAQLRERVLQRLQQGYAGFRATLDDARAATWDAELRALASARSGQVYVLDAEGRPQPVRVRLGTSDGSHTEILGGLEEGQPVVVGTAAAAP